MIDPSLPTSPEQQRALERFYYREARLLDNRQYRQWLALVSEEIQYRVPSRVNVQVGKPARPHPQDHRQRRAPGAGRR